MNNFKDFIAENVDQRFHFLQKGNHFNFKGDKHTWVKISDTHGINKDYLTGPKAFKVHPKAKVEKLDIPDHNFNEETEEKCQHEINTKAFHTISGFRVKSKVKGCNNKSYKNCENPSCKKPVCTQHGAIDGKVNKFLCPDCWGNHTSSSFNEEINDEEPIKVPVNTSSENVVNESIVSKVRNLYFKHRQQCKRCNGYGNILGRAKKFGSRDVHTTCNDCKGSGLRNYTPEEKSSKLKYIKSAPISESNLLLGKALDKLGLGKHEHYRKTIKLLPGVRLNLTKKGHSFSVGIPHARVSWNKTTKRTSVGIPKTGIYWSWSKSRKKKKAK